MNILFLTQIFFFLYNITTAITASGNTMMIIYTKYTRVNGDKRLKEFDTF